MRKFLSILLTMAMLLCAVPIATHAESITPNVSFSTIPENVAEIIATYFLRDSLSLPEISWTSSTEIASCETMYGVNDEISAYSFELATDSEYAGYIVISAYPDVPNVVLEFSDETVPVYNYLGLEKGDKVVYTGLLNYYKNSGEEKLITLENKEVLPTEVPTPLVASRNSSNIKNRAVTFSYPINDPFAWADTYYDGPFVYGGESINNFESYCNFRKTSDFSGYDNHCGPTAITNLLEMVGGLYGYSSINNTSHTDIFEAVADYGTENDYFSNSGGTIRNTLNTYIDGSFALYDVDVSVSSKNATFNNIKTALTNNRPFYLTLKNFPTYQNHGVAGYAYTRLQSETTGYYLSFIKIADGWVNYGRYLDIASIDESSEAEMRVITVNTGE